LERRAAPPSEAELARLLRDEARRPFDLGRGPLVRLALFPLPAAEHCLSLAGHHIVLDAWSLGVLFQALMAAYPARAGAGGGRAEGATLFMTLMAAFQALLHRYTGQTDLTVGTATAGRPSPELAGTMGFFVNTVVIRGDLSGDPSFRTFLARVREACLEAYDH